METIIAIIFVVFGILQIILFFKIWGMTNDIREIKRKYLYQDKEGNFNKALDQNGLHEGMLVVHLKTEEQMRIGELQEDGKYRCMSDGMYVGAFYPSDLMEFEEWRKSVYKK